MFNSIHIFVEGTKEKRVHVDLTQHICMQQPRKFKLVKLKILWAIDMMKDILETLNLFVIQFLYSYYKHLVIVYWLSGN